MQLNSAIGHIKAGKLRALAVTSDKRMAELPDVPNMLDKEDKLVVPMIKKLGIKTE
jgi:tripartite-type tricarboxylate transporter receptor subunit TctC